jgi:hypothetical protein
MQAKSRLCKKISEEELERCYKFEKAWSKAAKKREAPIGTNIFHQQANRYLENNQTSWSP